ncbi:RecQ family ATP-dependent DNA helicase [Rathayibacter sp. YIM 133350]|uniref:RecQ family ATP-dependent DNA helicase n=1 Tax=Rathayibacter sp. YIM 133350 TaxID=3131992 RepID=UPI00307CF7C6
MDSATAGVGERASRVARRVFGIEALKPAQLDAISAVEQGDDVLAVMPTGYGKSAIYQVAAHLLDGPAVVVSPLIALQLDQVRHIAAATGEESAVAINSQQGERATERSWQAVASGEAEFIFLAPEQLARDEVMQELAEVGVSLFVVDEAHCVSSWGHDFRPDYLRLGDVIAALGHPRTLALTATGSSPVRAEIIERLGMRTPRVLVGGFDRPNVHLAVVRHESDRDKTESVIDRVVRSAHPGLLYAATRADTETLAEELAGRGLRAAYYHAGMGTRLRRETHERFLADEFDVVVATSAFGMGIDKPNVRFVVHADITESLDAYYQEVGRSGRDGERAEATLHYRAEDLGLRRFFAGGSPDRDRVLAVDEAIAAEGGGASVNDIAASTAMAARTVQNIVNLLREAALIRVGEDGRCQRLPRAASTDAATAVEEVVERRIRIAESRLAMIRGYAETERCRRQFLLEYFGDELTEPCGNCDTCESGTAYEFAAVEAAETAPDDGFRLDQPVRHSTWGEGRVMSIEPDRITVFFDEGGYRVLSREIVDDGDLLEAI